MSTRIRRFTLLTAGLLAAAAPAYALMHNRLIKSAPLSGETGAAPKAISLWFAEKPEVPLSAITLKASDSSTVKLGAVALMTGEKNAITATVNAPLAAGVYEVQYKTAGADGHPLRGRYVFTVK